MMLLCLVLFCCASLVRTYETDINHAFQTHQQGGASTHEGVVTVHVVPHTHDDVGWLKTVDQYYYGSREDIYKGGVQYIIDTVIEELLADPNKTFIYVEIAFFKRWWEEQDEGTRGNVRTLLKNKQLEFINAGYCMNDEASVHYAATIDQMGEGLRWLQQEVAGGREEEGDAIAPSVAWQIDPFGHSSAHADLSAQMGLKGLFFARMHYQDYDKRKENKDLEFNWDLESESMFTGVLYRHYNAPPGFNFDRRGIARPMVENTNSPEYDIQERVEDFITQLNEQASHYRSGNIMLTMGGDFCYQNARKYFKNLDILMKYVNANSTLNGFRMIYSTPTRYMADVLEDIGPMQNKTDDLFPYADGPQSYWTGYFTSRPTLKGYVRTCNNVLQTCKQIEALLEDPEKHSSEKLRLAMGVAQHHDAVSGTSKQHVADDYVRRLAAGHTDCEDLINTALKTATQHNHKLFSCRFLNESFCEVTADGNSSFTVVAYNPRIIPRVEYIRIPLPHPHYQVIELHSERVLPLEFVSVSPRTRQINSRAQPMEGVFRATLPPLGWSSYQLQLTIHQTAPVLKSIHVDRGEPLIVESQVYRIYFNPDTGAMIRITNKLSGLEGMTDSITQRFMQYGSSVGDKADRQPSGAYIFRPMNDKADDLGDPILTDYVPGDQVTEIWQTFNEWISQVTRVYYDKLYIEVEWTVGPIPPDYGREVITRYETSLRTNKTFFTDSNGREMVRRVLNHQPTWDLNVTSPIAGNYYPVNTRARIEDGRMQLTVLTDRSQGAASLSDGRLELMLHRRILKDDLKGVSEPLNETANGRGLIARGKHWLFYSDKRSLQLHRDVGLDLFYRPTLAVSKGEGEPGIPSQSYFTGPHNQFLNLLSVQRVNDTAMLVRLESTVQASEGNTEHIKVNLGSLIRGRTLANYQEMGLAGDRDISKVKDYAEQTKLDNGNTIALKPFQIRTFILISKKDEENNSTEF